jgi:hypothetical protein
LRDAISKITREKLTGGVVQAVELLLCKCKALNSNPSPTQNKQKSKQKKTSVKEDGGDGEMF